MLVCNISLRPARRAIAATVAEAAAASDASTTGQVVFATLVDDPASVNDLVDAYLGEIMLEAASASDSYTSGSDYSAAVDEAVTPADTQDATVAGAGVARQAMVPGVFIDTDASRETYVPGVMINRG